MQRTVAFETLGCKLNQYETDAIAAGFLEQGWQIVDPKVGADVYVLNTCTVTNKADKKSRSLLKQSLETPGNPVVVVTGCFAEGARQALAAEAGISLVVPNDNKNQIVQLVEQFLDQASPGAPLPNPDRFQFPVQGATFHTRASLKIQDGCDNFCTFCIIPSVRGPAISRPLEDVLKTAKELISTGRKELVLTGVNMGKWERGPFTFVDLVSSLLALEGDFRLRITSLEPENLGEAFASLLLHPKMTPHLHLCLQSGSPRILSEMHRQYTLDQYRTLVARLKAQSPSLNLTTDVIVGFPGETEQEFEQSLQAIEELGFGHVHVFPYSRRRNTPADQMVAQITQEVKRRRSHNAREKAKAQRRTVMERLVGQERRILVETPDSRRREGEWVRGLTEDYFPVRFQGTGAWNTFVRVKLVWVVSEATEWVFEAQPLWD